MEKRNVYIGVSIILIILALFLVAGSFLDKISGKVFESTNRLCNDSDGGLNRYEKGTIIYSYKTNYGEYTDYCYEETARGYKRLSEYYCTVYDKIRTKRYICENGCVNGACVKSLIQNCTDSDNGLNYYVKGKVCINSKCEEDLCLDEKYLSERKCDNLNKIESRIYECSEKCESGRCI